MSEQVTTRVLIGERLRERPELADAATQTADYLRSRIRGVPPPAEIRWEWTPTDPTTIELSMSDSPTFDDAVSGHILVTRFGDPAQRRMFILDVWQDLLDVRLRTIRARLDAKMREYAREYYDSPELATPDA
jgi:hypothetical protein